MNSFKVTFRLFLLFNLLTSEKQKKIVFRQDSSFLMNCFFSRNFFSYVTRKISLVFKSFLENVSKFFHFFKKAEECYWSFLRHSIMNINKCIFSQFWCSFFTILVLKKRKPTRYFGKCVWLIALFPDNRMPKRTTNFNFAGFWNSLFSKTT